MADDPAGWLEAMARDATRRAAAGLRRGLDPRGPGSQISDSFGPNAALTWPGTDPPGPPGGPPGPPGVLSGPPGVLSGPPGGTPGRNGDAPGPGDDPIVTGDNMIDLAGNDYLGLSAHPAVLAAARRALAGYGLGATGSRLVRGSTRAHAALEAGLAAWLGVEGALVFSSGYLANLAAVRALAGPGTLLVSDAHNHASLIDGCRMSGARVVVAPHADPVALDAILAAHPDMPAVVVTESVFSVDGDLAPLASLHRVCRARGARLLVDDAHALGLLGPSGAGGVASAGLAGQPDVVITATLSKALGASGGLVAGPRVLVDHLVDTARTFIFDTALPPSVAAGALAALHLARSGDDLRAEAADRASSLARRLAAAGLAAPAPAAGIVPVPAAGPEQALAWARACRGHGVVVGAFRPPSTPDGGSRLRLTINAGIPRQRFEHAVDVVIKDAP